MVPNRRLRVDHPPRPANLYGATKVFGEAVARYYADHRGLRVACLRVGWVEPHDTPRAREMPLLARLWCGPLDLASLIVAAIDSSVRFATVFSVSSPATMFFDVANPYGWQPVEVLEQATRSHLAATRLWGLVATLRRP
jgi:nucleoside-diphosphate-sugar epimerase